MRAAVVTSYGGPEVIAVQDVADPAPGPGEVTKPDISAPGVAIFAAGAGAGTKTTPLPNDGTSLSTPHVAGVLAWPCRRARRSASRC